MIKDTDYAYAVARLKANENKLLTSSDIEALISCRTLRQCFELLSAKGWSVSEESTVAQILSRQNKELWVLLCESVPDKSVLNVLTVLNDYFNLKAAVKASLTASDPERLFVYPTSVDLDLLKEAVKMREFSRLGDEKGNAAEEAYKTALTSGSGQAADIILDKAALDCLVRLSDGSKSELVKETARLICTFADIRTAYRSAKTKKSESFLDKALSDGGALERKTLIEKSLKGEKELIAYLEKTEFHKAAQLIEKSTTEFEKYCDDAVLENAKKAKYMFLGFEPVMAFYYAKQAELKTVRILLGAKQNGLSDNALRERVRALYV